MPICIVPFDKPANKFFAADIIIRKAYRTFERSLIRNPLLSFLEALEIVYQLQEFLSRFGKSDRGAFIGRSSTKTVGWEAAFLPNLRLKEVFPYGGLRLFFQAAQTFLGKRAKFWRGFKEFMLHFNGIVL